LVRSKASLWPSAAPDCARAVVAAAAPIAVVTAKARNSQNFKNRDLKTGDLVKRWSVKALFPRSSAGNIMVQSINAIA
jgi:hypothetical protein